MADSARLSRAQRMPSEGSGTSVVSLAGLVLGAVAVGTALWWIGGPPHLSSAWPDWERIGQIMTGSHLPYADVIEVAKGLGWLALAYLALTMALRVTGQALVGVTDGAAWARASLHMSDAVTIPVVRRIVDGAVAGALVLAVWLRAGPTTEAAASAGSLIVAVTAPAEPVPPREGRGPAPGEPISEDADRAGPADRSVSYTVVPGDNLWDISRRFYGDGTQYTVIFRANADHVMYRVRPGDSLWRIAESFLDDALRWTEIWDLNQGRGMGGGQWFTDPSL